MGEERAFPVASRGLQSRSMQGSMKDFTTADALGILSDTLERVQREHKNNIVSNITLRKKTKMYLTFNFKETRPSLNLTGKGETNVP